MDTAKNKPANIIGNCLECRGLVRISSSADANSTVRCPHCSSSFPLQQIITEAIPELELVDERSQGTDTASVPHVDRKIAKAEGESREKFVVPVQLSEGAKRRSRRRRDSTFRVDEKETTNPSDFDDIATEDNASDFVVRQATERRNEKSDSGRSSHRSSSRSHSSRSRSSSSDGSSRSKRRRKRRSSQKQPGTIGEMLKIVIGGLLAFPIAYLLVLWIFKQDPLHIAPSIGKIAPMVVPDELLGPAAAPAPEIEESVEPADDIELDEDLPIPDKDPDSISRKDIGN